MGEDPLAARSPHDKAPLDPTEEQSLVAVVARRAVVETAPEELPLFKRTSEAYFRNPDAVLAERGAKDDTLGFGVDAGAALVLVTPIALEVAKNVVHFLGSVIGTAVKDEAVPRLRQLLGSLLEPQAGAETRHGQHKTMLTREQLDEVHAIALETASRLRMSPQRAAMLADAVVGSLAR